MDQSKKHEEKYIKTFIENFIMSAQLKLQK